MTASTHQLFGVSAKEAYTVTGLPPVGTALGTPYHPPGTPPPGGTRVDPNTNLPTSGQQIPGVNTPAANNAPASTVTGLAGSVSSLLGNFSWQTALTWILAGGALVTIWKFFHKK